MNPISSLHPEVAARVNWLLAAARYYGVPVTVTSTTRSSAYQARLRSNYEQCLARGLVGSSTSLVPGMSCRYPANRPGDSAHEFGVAFDSSVPDEWLPTWTWLREYAGFRVADENGDPIHAEVPDWRRFRDAGVIQPVP